MKEIVLIFVQAQDLNLPAEQPPGAAKTDSGDQSMVDIESAQPFWTWFIENPRPRSSRSFNSAAGLTFATQSA
jgi:hypothetical protein